MTGAEDTNGTPASVPTASDAEQNRGLVPTKPAKEKKTVEELARMILQDLSKVEGCQGRGLP
jgi:hypothetical protein